MKPVVAVAGIAFDDDGRVLLIQRGKEPGRGLWTVPGGSLELGESMSEAVAREMREETGMEVEVGDLVTIVERVLRADGGGDIEHHFVICDYAVTVVGGTLAAGDDAADARWLTPDEVADLPLTAGLADVLDIARQLR